jgi:S-(hydroxymethyl)glutathione dehydrogenase/alcohol dehydrogenase
MKFKAAVLSEIDKPLIISDVETTKLKIGQVLVKILVSGLCGAQLQEISGLKGNSKFVPHLLGHEGCGIVEEIGDGVTKVKVGDKVVMHWRKGDGIESDFPSYVYNGEKMSSGKVTTLSEYSVVSENRLTKVPNDTPNELCALLGCGLTTALGVINNEASIKFGESLMIVGCGGVGLNLIQGGKLANANPIYCLDITEEKRDLSISLGGDKYINSSISDINSEINNEKFDVIIDTTGNPNVIKETIKYLSNNGRYILVGQPKPGQDIIIPNGNSMFNGNGIVVKATQGGKTSPTDDIPRYVKLHKSGVIDITKIITNRFKLNEINDAITMLRSGKCGRIMIEMN